MIDDVLIARGLHVLGVVLWIGGVAMETTVLLPVMRRNPDLEERTKWFKEIEHTFSWQARLTTLLVGVTGFYMLFALDGWDRFAQLDQFWLHGMVLLWVLFSTILFVLEPLVLHQWFERRIASDPEGTFALIYQMHWVLLTVSILVVVCGVIGAHGGAFFE